MVRPGFGRVSPDWTIPPQHRPHPSHDFAVQVATGDGPWVIRATTNDRREAGRIVRELFDGHRMIRVVQVSRVNGSVW